MAEYFEKEKLCDWCLNTGPSYCDICVMNRHDLPNADARPVVLCRDCVHARRYTNKIKCGYWSEQTASEIVCEDDFCSYGEKREES